jgi:hypothetical protein
MERYFCPICGFEGMTSPAYSGGDERGYPMDAICPCCGVQFGYTDAAGLRRMSRIEWHEKMRRAWIADGMRWHAISPLPPGWDPVAQLGRLRQRAQERGEWSPF